MFDFIVLGATGMQGRIVSRDLLSNGYSVLLSGRDRSKIQKLLKRYKKSEFEYADLRDSRQTIATLKISGAPIVINCAEGDYNYAAQKAALSAGLHYLDLGSDQGITRDQFRLNDDFKKKNLVAITGCGSTPGIVSVMARYASAQFDTLNTVDVGFAWNSNMPVFVPPFSIASITEEFAEDANIFQNGKFARKAPDTCKIEFDYFGIGKQKTCYTRHPEPFTFAKYFQDKGIQNVSVYSSFPPHSWNTMKMFVDLGLASKEEVMLGDHKIAPINFLTEIMKRVKIPKGYKETENLWAKLSGKKDGKDKTVQMDCLAHTLKGWEALNYETQKLFFFRRNKNQPTIIGFCI